DLDALVATLAKATLDGKESAATVWERLIGQKQARFITPELMLPLAHLLPAAEIAELLGDPAQLSHQAIGYGIGRNFVEGFRRYVLPRLSDPEIEDYRARLRPHITVANFPTDYYTVAVPFQLAAALGMDELRPVVDSWADDHYRKADWNDYYHAPQL